MHEVERHSVLKIQSFLEKALVSRVKRLMLILIDLSSPVFASMSHQMLANYGKRAMMQAWTR